MTYDEDRDRELDDLLRQPLERLGPPAGSWERVSRRARRRKFMKAALAVSAAVIVVAGAVPAIIAVRHDSSNQSLQYASPTTTPSVAVNTPKPASSTTPSSPAPSPSVSSAPTTIPAVPAVDPALNGFRPESLSFISYQQGYVWGSIGSSKTGVIAYTNNDGTNWYVAKPPPAETAFGGTTVGDSQIRFANASLGFVYGGDSYVTDDGAQTWTPFTTKGYVTDLEAMHKHVWALIRSCDTCDDIQLFSTKDATPHLAKVTAVPGIQSAPSKTTPGTDAIAVSGPRVDVLIGSDAYYSSKNGKAWTPQEKSPCAATLNGTALSTALLSSWGTAGVIAACGYDGTNDTQTKQLFTTTNGGTSWQPVAGTPADAGEMQTLSASAQADLIIANTNGEAQISNDTGANWSDESPNGVSLSFAGFISPNHIVALADDGPGAAEFTTTLEGSADAKTQTWTPTLFK